MQPTYPARLQELPYLSGLSGPAHERNDRHPKTALALRAGRVFCRAVPVDRATPAYRGYPAKTASGFVLRSRCAARFCDGWPAGCSGNPRKANPHTPCRGAFACVCDVIRPPERFAATIRGSPGSKRMRRSHGGADRCLRQLRRIGPPSATLHVWKLVAQSGDAAPCKFCRHGYHEVMIHSCSRAMRQHVASPCSGPAFAASRKRERHR